MTNLKIAAFLSFVFSAAVCAAQAGSSAAAEAADLANRGQFEQAAAKFSEAIKQEPQNASLHLSLGLTYQSLRRYEDAIKALEEAARISPSLTEAHYSLGLLYEAAANWGKAGEAWSVVLRQEKNQQRKSIAKKHLARIKHEMEGKK